MFTRAENVSFYRNEKPTRLSQFFFVTLSREVINLNTRIVCTADKEIIIPAYSIVWLSASFYNSIFTAFWMLHSRMKIADNDNELTNREMRLKRTAKTLNYFLLMNVWHYFLCRSHCKQQYEDNTRWKRRFASISLLVRKLQKLQQKAFNHSIG